MHVQIVKLCHMSIPGQEPRSAFPCMRLVGTVATKTEMESIAPAHCALGNRLMKITPPCREKRRRVLVSNGYGRRHDRTGYLFKECLVPKGLELRWDL